MLVAFMPFVIFVVHFQYKILSLCKPLLVKGEGKNRKKISFCEEDDVH